MFSITSFRLLLSLKLQSFHIYPCSATPTSYSACFFCCLADVYNVVVLCQKRFWVFIRLNVTFIVLQFVCVKNADMRL